MREKSERAEKLFWVDGLFRTRREAGLTYRSQSMGELDRVLERRRKLEALLKGTGARGPARGRRRKQAENELEEIEHFLTGFESGLARRDQNKRAHARERRRKSLERVEAARTAMTQRKDVQTEWVITTFRSAVDGLKAGTISPDHSPILPPRTTSSNPDPQVDIGILQRLGFVKSGQMLGDQLGWSEAWIPEPERRLFFHRRLARPSTTLCGICGPRSRTADSSAVYLETNERPLWTPGIPVYLPKHGASKHHCLLRKRPVFLCELTQHFRGPRSRRSNSGIRGTIDSARRCASSAGRLLNSRNKFCFIYVDLVAARRCPVGLDQ